MENEKKNKSDTRNWNDMKNDILLKIFMTLNVVDFVTVSLVCSSWRKACQEIIFWEKFDLSSLSFDSGKIPFRPHDSSNEQSNTRLTQFLKCALDLSNGKISCLVFNFLLSINDIHLLSAAQRTPNLKRLVLPGWNELSERGINQAIHLWEGLESMTIPTLSGAYDILEAVAKYCNNFSELKVTCDFSIKLAKALIKHVPKLKVLSIQSTMVNKDGLVRVVDQLEHLEVLNVSHSFIVGVSFNPRNILVYRQHEVPEIARNVSRIRNLVVCEGICRVCPQILNWNLTGEWKLHREAVWREDRVASLGV